MPPGDLWQIKEYHYHKPYRPAANYSNLRPDHQLVAADG